MPYGHTLEALNKAASQNGPSSMSGVIPEVRPLDPDPQPAAGETSMGTPSLGQAPSIGFQTMPRRQSRFQRQLVQYDSDYQSYQDAYRQWRLGGAIGEPPVEPQRPTTSFSGPGPGVREREQQQTEELLQQILGFTRRQPGGTAMSAPQGVQSQAGMGAGMDVKGGQGTGMGAGF